VAETATAEVAATKQKPSDAQASSPEPPSESALPWLSQLTAALAIVAAAIGRIIAPGLRGSAAQHTVDAAESIGNFTAFALVVFLLFLLGRAGWDLAFRNRPSVPLRVAVVSGSTSVALLLLIVMFKNQSIPVPTPALISLTLIASGVTLIGGFGTIRPPHTRAVAFVLCAFGLASLVRLIAWQLAAVAGHHASPMLYTWGRGVSTVGVLLEGIGQVLAVIWLTTRTRVSGQILAGVAVVVAMVVTWGVSEGGHPGAAAWQAVLHTSLSDVRGTPPPFGLSAVPTFLVTTSILFAAIAVIRPGPAPAITSALALFLIGRGAFDVPLRALSACVGATWLLVASVDERTMWRALAARRDSLTGLKKIETENDLAPDSSHGPKIAPSPK
jgi:hypothetical protein